MHGLVGLDILEERSLQIKKGEQNQKQRDHSQDAAYSSECETEERPQDYTIETNPGHAEASGVDCMHILEEVVLLLDEDTPHILRRTHNCEVSCNKEVVQLLEVGDESRSSCFSLVEE